MVSVRDGLPRVLEALERDEIIDPSAFRVAASAAERRAPWLQDECEELGWSYWPDVLSLHKGDLRYLVERPPEALGLSRRAIAWGKARGLPEEWIGEAENLFDLLYLAASLPRSIADEHAPACAFADLVLHAMSGGFFPCGWEGEHPDGRLLVARF